jgi:PHS family inorganic phosphate transporter-like MFS transporter
MIGYVYHNGGSNTANQDLGVKVAHSIGTFIGQLLFGWLGDKVGRKRMYGIELVSLAGKELIQIVIIIGTLGTALAGGSLGISVYGVIIWWRFFMVRLLHLHCLHTVESLQTGRGYRRRLPRFERHYLRICCPPHPWSHDGCRLFRSGLGQS